MLSIAQINVLGKGYTNTKLMQHIKDDESLKKCPEFWSNGIFLLFGNVDDYKGKTIAKIRESIDWEEFPNPVAIEEMRASCKIPAYPVEIGLFNTPANSEIPLVRVVTGIGQEAWYDAHLLATFIKRVTDKGHKVKYHVSENAGFLRVSNGADIGILAPMALTTEQVVPGAYHMVNVEGTPLENAPETAVVVVEVPEPEEEPTPEPEEVPEPEPVGQTSYGTPDFDADHAYLEENTPGADGEARFTVYESAFDRALEDALKIPVKEKMIGGIVVIENGLIMCGNEIEDDKGYWPDIEAGIATAEMCGEDLDQPFLGIWYTKHKNGKVTKTDLECAKFIGGPEYMGVGILTISPKMVRIILHTGKTFLERPR